MSRSEFFPTRISANPTIYAYEDTHPQYKGLLKIGYTIKTAQERVAEQYPTQRPGEKPYRIVLDEPAIKENGSTFTDHDVHRMLRKSGFSNPSGEWFRCSVSDVMTAIISIKKGYDVGVSRSLSFDMRPEQKQAVSKTLNYFQAFKKENPDKVPHFLWNAKMRFGKTFATYQLAKAMGWKRILVLTFKPAVQDAWEEDLKTHIDFDGWQFICNKGKKKDECLLDVENLDLNKPIVCFGSFQDFLGTNKQGGIKAKNEWVHATNWDCVVLDEYHFGSWRESAKELFEAESRKQKRTRIWARCWY